MKEWIYRKLCQLRDQKRHNIYKLRWEKEKWQRLVQNMKEKKKQ